MFDTTTLYFRRRDNGAAIYRLVDTNTKRLDLQQIGVIKPDGEIKAQGKHEITDAETAEIMAWHHHREDQKRDLEAARVDRLIDELNAVTQWIQADADDDQIREAAEPLFLAMHDMRATLVRRLGNSRG